MKPSKRPQECRHCHRTLSTYAQGLCCRCVRTPGVREMYPKSVFAHRGHGAAGMANVPLPEPTLALPGTPEKVAVLESRAEAGQALHHPRDAKRDDDEPLVREPDFLDLLDLEEPSWKQIGIGESIYQ